MASHYPETPTKGSHYPVPELYCPVRSKDPLNLLSPPPAQRPPIPPGLPPFYPPDFHPVRQNYGLFQ